MIGLIATYLSTTSFTVGGDKTDEFNEGRRVRAECNSIYKYCTTANSTYSAPNTTVTLTDDSDDLDSGLTSVWYGISANGAGSLPTHTHDSTAGEGGNVEHNILDNLDYASAGHTGFSANTHLHDDRYFTETETDTWRNSTTQTEMGYVHGVTSDIQTQLDDKSDTSHKDTHDPVDGSDPLDVAAAAEIIGVQAAGIGTSHALAGADHVHQIQHGITDNHLVTVDGSITDGDYAKWTADGLNGRSILETKTDMGYMTDLVDDTTPQLYDDLDGQGKYLVDVQNIPDLAAKGAGYYLDGVDDKIVVNDDAKIQNIFDNGGSIVLKFNPGSDGENSTGEVVYKFAAGSGYIVTTQLESGGFLSLKFRHEFSTTDGFWETDVIIPINTQSCFIVTYDNSSVSNNPSAYLNGKSITFTETGTPAGTRGADTGQDFAIGKGDWAYDGSVSSVLALNNILTADEVKAFSSGAPIPYKYIGASQTDLITNGGFDADTDWSKTTGWTIAGGVAHCDGTQTAITYLYQPISFVAGKKYRVKFTVTNFVAGYVYGRAGDTNGTYRYANGTYTDELVWLTGGNFSIGASINFIGDIDDITLDQIGCVLQLEQPGIGHTQWLDNSGNELHGAVDGAIPTNLPADNIERFRHNVAMTDDTVWADVVPAGYQFESIIFVESAGNTATLDLGTTTTGEDVFEQQIIAANTITTVVINKTFSLTSAQTLYLNDDGTGSWYGASLTATLLMRRII